MITLPVDIQVLVLPLLNSTSLIALSQTNEYFRHFIAPQKKQFVNRLLELECLPEYGGEVTINEQAKIIVPSGTVSYACTRCFKIISHINFDNHSLLRLRFRKPPPESRAGQQLCGWTSGDAKAQGLKRQADLRNDTLSNWLKNSSSEYPDWRWKELYKIGTARSRRMCNECKFVSGFWAWNAGMRTQNWRGNHRSSNIGTMDVPVVKGRQRRCHDSAERYFWGLFPLKTDTEYPWRWKIFREENCYWWTLWSIRCPGCSVWQERAAFRRGSAYGVKATPADPDAWRQLGSDGPHFDKWRRNRCVLASDGEEELGSQLLAFWKRLVEYEIFTFESLVPTGWFAVDEIAKVTNNKYSWERIVKRDSVSSQLQRSVPNAREITKMDAERKRHYFKILKRWIDSLEYPESVLSGIMDRHWFRPWLNQYEILEKRIDDLGAQTTFLEADPRILVKFALHAGGSLV